MSLRSVLACSVAAAFVLSAPALAAPPAATSGGSVYIASPVNSDLQITSDLGPLSLSGGPVTATINSSGSPNPFVLAHATIGAGTSDAANAGVQVAYSYEFQLQNSTFAQLLSQQVLDGQTNGFGAPTVRARGSGYFTSDAGSQTLSYIYGGLGAGSETRFLCSFGLGSCGFQDFDVAVAITSVNNLTFGGQVLLYASASAAAGPKAFSESLAYLDPQLYFLDHPEVTFTLSDGFTNATGGHNGPAGYENLFPGGNSGAPEPAAWALMISGFGLAGSALRWRRRAATA